MGSFSSLSVSSSERKTELNLSEQEARCNKFIFDYFLHNSTFFRLYEYLSKVEVKTDNLLSHQIKRFSAMTAFDKTKIWDIMIWDNKTNWLKVLSIVKTSSLEWLRFAADGFISVNSKIIESLAAIVSPSIKTVEFIRLTFDTDIFWRTLAALKYVPKVIFQNCTLNIDRKKNLGKAFAGSKIEIFWISGSIKGDDICENKKSIENIFEMLHAESQDLENLKEIRVIFSGLQCEYLKGFIGQNGFEKIKVLTRYRWKGKMLLLE
jgi:hypothetical protein